MFERFAQEVMKRISKPPIYPKTGEANMAGMCTRKHVSEAQVDKQQWAALCHDPKAAGLSLGKATQERSE